MIYSDQLTSEAEADRIIQEFGESSYLPIMEMLERHFLVLHNRAQVLLTLCGIIVSTTGFSGRNIAGTSTPAQVLVISGVLLVMIAAATVCWGVLHLRWLTMQPGQQLKDWLLVSLKYRDFKTRVYRIALFIMLIGLAAYVMAIIIMLLDPNAPHYPPR